LFAAHCIQEKNGTQIKKASESYFFFKNDYDTNDESANAYVSEFIVHPDWDPKDTHYTADIAIAVLKKPLELSLETQHVCLNTPLDSIQSFVERNASVYGWGFTEESRNASVTELRHVEVPLVDQALCKSRNLQKIMSDTSFCAGARDGKTGACNGKLTYFN
jgi:secreted trypsin-like serine protease